MTAIDPVYAIREHGACRHCSDAIALVWHGVECPRGRERAVACRNITCRRPGVWHASALCDSCRGVS